MKDTENKKIPISARITEEAYEKLMEIMQARGLDKTGAIEFALLQIPILKIGNVEDLAVEFCNIRRLIESEEYKAVKEEVDELCQFMYDLIVQVENQKELWSC